MSTDPLGKPQIYLGLPASGNAVQQRDAEFAKIRKRLELLQRSGLLPGELTGRIASHVTNHSRIEWIPLVGFVQQRYQPARSQAAEHVGGDAAVAKVRQRHGRRGSGKRAQRLPLLRAQTEVSVRDRGWRGPRHPRGQVRDNGNSRPAMRRQHRRAACAETRRLMLRAGRQRHRYGVADAGRRSTRRPTGTVQRSQAGGRHPRRRSPEGP